MHPRSRDVRDLIEVTTPPTAAAPLSPMILSLRLRGLGTMKEHQVRTMGGRIEHSDSWFPV